MKEETKKIKCNECENMIDPGNCERDDQGNSICEECFENGYFVCNDCHEIEKQCDERNTHDGRSICTDCMNANYFICSDCDEIYHTDDSRCLENGNLVCESCFDSDYGTCERCGDGFAQSDLHYCEECGADYCERCFENYHSSCGDGGEVDERTPSGRFYVGDKLGTMAINRCVGVEIEVEKCHDRGELGEALPSIVGVSEDGSLDDTGVEIQTPPSSGVEFEKIVRAVTKTINDRDCVATKSCGLHIHIDARDFRYRPAVLSKILRTYYALEPMLLSILPDSRYDNHFCQLMRKLYNYNDLSVRGINQLEEVWYKEPEKCLRDQRKSGKYDDSRYAGLNLHSLFYRGSIEIRYHSGTIDYEKIKHWANINLCIIEYALNYFDKDRIDRLAQQFQERTETSKRLTELADMLKLPGATKKYMASRIKKFNH